MKLILVFSSLLLINSHLFAHGGNKPGPHGGKIKMPGMFHTELILTGPNDFKVYLLDMKFKNPETKNSMVNYLIDGNREIPCKPKNNSFICKTKKKLEKGMNIKIHAKRLKKSGTATYKNVMKKMPLHVKSKMKSKMHH